MSQPFHPSGPRFIDERDEIIGPLPIFVTRTTLRSILHANGDNTASKSEDHSTAAINSESISTSKR